VWIPGYSVQIGDYFYERTGFWQDYQTNANFSWWGEFGRSFVRTLVNGVREPGESFGHCVNNNIRVMTFGAVDPKKLFDQGLAQAEGFAVVLSTIPVQAMGGRATISVAARLLISTARGVGLRGVAGRIVVGAGLRSVYALAVLGAATLGAGIGSSINCM